MRSARLPNQACANDCSFARSASIVGFASPAICGFDSARSQRRLSAGIDAATKEASSLRELGGSCAAKLLILSICSVACCSLGKAARADAGSVMP